MSDRGEVVPEEVSNSKQAFTTCAKCGLLIVGQFVRALGGTYHLECFKCQDCGTIVAAKFFPIDGLEGKQHPLCERDYFRRLNLICEKCGGALRGSYITALDKKYHIEHFTCSACPTVFGPQDSYYEHDGQVYCHYHYSTRFAVKCTGCQTAILKQFVEINRNSIDEHWHPECYMIHKLHAFLYLTHEEDLINLIDGCTYDKQGSENVDQPEPEISSPEELKNQQKAMEEKVYNIWTVLSTFEEMSAACISDMLIHVSNGSYFNGVKMAEKFINHVEILFSAIDDLEAQLIKASGQGLQHNREAKMLCKKIVNFFSLLSNTQETDVRRLGITQELLSLVTGLAHYLKILIRIALTGALKLERDFENSTAIGQFLNKLSELTNKGSQQDKETNVDGEATSDLCHACRITVEEECYKYGHYRWHIGCLRCSGCSRELRTIFKDASFNQITEMAFCPRDTNEQSAKGFQRKDESQNPSAIDVNRGRKDQKSEVGIVRRDSMLKSYSSGDNYDPLNKTDIKRMKSVHMDRKLSTSARIATRSRIIEQESEPSTSSIPDDSAKDKLARAPSQHHVKIVQDQVFDLQTQENRIKFDSQNEAITLADISALAAASMAENIPDDKANNESRRNSRSKSYLSELSALEYFIVKHVAVLAMEQLLKEHFSLEELLDLIGLKKANFWTKFVTSIKPAEKKPVKKKGTFGVALDILVERYGIDSVLGAGPGRIRVPSFVDDSISAMKTMDMSVEGIFRKNGNIRRLKDLSEAIDKNPSAVNLSEDNPVQVAALMKKFLRDLPDPLLTFKLHKIFITSQKLQNEADRKKILHLACCLLPKINRDTMEVLFIFFKWVASFSHVDEETGSKMDLHNLATVITPNILYSKSKDPTKDDSFLAIEAVHSLLKYQDDFWVVCYGDFILNQIRYLLNNPEGLTSKDILKRCEKFVSLKKENVNMNDNLSEGSSSGGDGDIQASRHNNNPQHQTFIEKGNNDNHQNANSTNIYPASSSSIVNSESSIPVEQRAS
ncbi:13714_t:CDS:10 [Funneliformis geosporum]|uniref:19904_t:CDS:1 n=1 Tax=Funneliformis geosporum TaxID=1117311 RepID=A0A9W4SII2_9GLOM|nr:13714_t:CDS:10 [Funneliformis geosporum]CAI2168262.1 19904_t:CDS:10 [Funneliformis geosporum]